MGRGDGRAGGPLRARAPANASASYYTWERQQQIL